MVAIAVCMAADEVPCALAAHTAIAGAPTKSADAASDDWTQAVMRTLADCSNPASLKSHQPCPVCLQLRSLP